MIPVVAKPACSKRATVSARATYPSVWIPSGSGQRRQNGSPIAANPPRRTVGRSAAAASAIVPQTNVAPRQSAASQASDSSSSADACRFGSRRAARARSRRPVFAPPPRRPLVARSRARGSRMSTPESRRGHPCRRRCRARDSRSSGGDSRRGGGLLRARRVLDVVVAFDHFPAPAHDRRHLTENGASGRSSRVSEVAIATPQRTGWTRPFQPGPSVASLPGR
jgi:hypothetical protein